MYLLRLGLYITAESFYYGFFRLGEQINFLNKSRIK